MSEASYEEEKEQRHQIHERALYARYHLIRVTETYYGVITFESQHEVKDQEYSVYRFIEGLEITSVDRAKRIVQSLNQGYTSEEDYAKI